MSEYGRPDCASCRGRGEEDGSYTRGPGICTSCRGTGKALTPDEDEVFRMVERMVNNRLRWGMR